ncbi:Glu-tRNA(Gln) amidotransferase subunit GatD [Candidatus Bathyarchaeota archaeon]|nr:Glu-tRNA(Gln) amidotransferase subunit GatD [Candidatus Bathyarchaeota archaeon]
MSVDPLSGYRGKLLELLNSTNLQIGDVVRINVNNVIYEGVLMPRVESADDWHIVIKQKSGYNIGIAYTDNFSIEKIGEAIKPEFRASPLPKGNSMLPRVNIVSTGGTIASRVDYVTGGVFAAMSSKDLLSIVPELVEIANIDASILYNVFSENINSDHWSGIANEVINKINEGADGIVITHGTDTMGYSTAALSFAIQNLPIPIIFVGSQRSSDRPSADSATNLVAAVKAAAYAPFSGVFLCMHEGTSDDKIIFHPGTKVRKCHTSTRYAFQTINDSPIARYINSELEIINKNFRKRSNSEPILKNKFEKKVALVKFYPGFNPLIIDNLIDAGFKGIILEGTGLGHVSEKCYDSLKTAQKNDVLIGMTSQCLWGRVNMNVYSMGRELTSRGVIPLEDMLPETAYVKMMWCLGQTNDIHEARNLLSTNIAGEFNYRSIYQRLI